MNVILQTLWESRLIGSSWLACWSGIYISKRARSVHSIDELLGVKPKLERLMWKGVGSKLEEKKVFIDGTIIAQKGSWKRGEMFDSGEACEWLCEKLVKKDVFTGVVFTTTCKKGSPTSSVTKDMVTSPFWNCIWNPRKPLITEMMRHEEAGGDTMVIRSYVPYKGLILNLNRPHRDTTEVILPKSICTADDNHVWLVGVVCFLQSCSHYVAIVRALDKGVPCWNLYDDVSKEKLSSLEDIPEWAKMSCTIVFYSA